jgi:hypothetical protein
MQRYKHFLNIQAFYQKKMVRTGFEPAGCFNRYFVGANGGHPYLMPSVNRFHCYRVTNFTTRIVSPTLFLSCAPTPPDQNKQ